MASVSRALRSQGVLGVRELALLRPASVDSLAVLHFRDCDDVPRQQFRDAVDAAKREMAEKEMLSPPLPPPPPLSTIKVFTPVLMIPL